MAKYNPKTPAETMIQRVGKSGNSRGKESMRTVIIAVLVTVLGAGCATMVKGSRGKIGISSTPSGARLSVDGQHHTTPAVVKLSKKRDHVIIMEKEGYETAHATLTSNLNGWWAANFVWSYLFPIGMAIDFSNGATYTLEPSVVHLQLLPEQQKDNSK